MTEQQNRTGNVWDGFWNKSCPAPTSSTSFREANTKRTIDFFLAQQITFKAGLKVLECGCGDGEVALAIAERFPVNVIGIDFSIEACQTTAKRAEERNLSICTIRADARRLPLDDNSVDRVVSLGVIEHDTHPIKQLKELARVIKPNGIMALMTPNAYSFAKFDRLWRERKGTWPIGYQREYSPKALQKMCREVGFTKMKSTVRLRHQTKEGNAPIDKVAYYDKLVSKLTRSKNWGYYSWVFAQKL